MDALTYSFDFRVGGLTVARAFADQRPSGVFVYVGDPAKDVNQVVAVAGAGT
jgi:glutamate racemase